MSRYRLVESQYVPGWILANPAGLADLDVTARSDDELLLICPSSATQAERERVVAMLRAEGHEVVVDGEGRVSRRPVVPGDPS